MAAEAVRIGAGSARTFAATPDTREGATITRPRLVCTKADMPNTRADEEGAMSLAYFRSLKANSFVSVRT